jgi:hypothetical protein
LLNRAVDVAQTVGWHAQRDHLADAHHHIPGDDLHPGRGKFLVVILVLELLVDLIERLALVVLEKHGEKERVLRRRRLLCVRAACRRQRDNEHATRQREQLHLDTRHCGSPLDKARRRGIHSITPAASASNVGGLPRTASRTLPHRSRENAAGIPSRIQVHCLGRARPAR